MPFPLISPLLGPSFNFQQVAQTKVTVTGQVLVGSLQQDLVDSPLVIQLKDQLPAQVEAAQSSTDM